MCCLVKLIHANFRETDVLAPVLYNGGYEQYTTGYCTDFEMRVTY